MSNERQQESRVKKTLLNARVNLIFYFLILCLSFFSRKIFLNCLGTEFVGLTGTLQNLLGFLNLAELGVGSAIGYLLYKPLFERDQPKINEIISVMGYLYRWIGFVILGGGCILACFLPLIFPDAGFDLWLIYAAYFAFLGSALIGYFINYRQNLLGADQRNYVVTAYFQTMNIVKTILQMVLAYYTRNLYLWIIIEFVFGIIYSFILNWKINQTYPWLRADVKLGRAVFKKYPEVMKYTKQLFVHRIAANATMQSYNIIIYAFTSLKVVALYGNYTIILDKIFGLLSSLLGSVTAGVGNLVAEGNNQKTINVFAELSSMTNYIGGIFTFAMITLSSSFIELWLGADYVISIWILMPMFIKRYCDFTTTYLGTFLYGYGLFYDVWAPIVESVICVTVAIVCGHYWGLFGVLLGNMVSNIIINLIWKSYFLYHKGFKSQWLKFWRFFIVAVLIQLFSAVTTVYIYNYVGYASPNVYVSFGVKALVSVLLFALISGMLFYTFNAGFRLFIGRWVTKLQINIKKK